MDEKYEVTKNDYISFLEQIKPEARMVNNKDAADYQLIEVLSKNTHKLLCARYVPNNKNDSPKFYIYNFPDKDESRPPIPKLHINLESKEEAQAFFNVINKMISDRHD